MESTVYALLRDAVAILCLLTTTSAVYGSILSRTRIRANVEICGQPADWYDLWVRFVHSPSYPKLKNVQQGWFYIGVGAIAHKPLPAPKYDIKHWSTNSKHRHIGASRGFCGFINTPESFSGWGSVPDTAGKAHETPRPPNRLGRDTLPISHSTRHLWRFDSPAFGFRPP